MPFDSHCHFEPGDDIPALRAEADDLYEQMGAVRPAVSRVTIRQTRR